jgi:hypothetical protein
VLDQLTARISPLRGASIGKKQPYRGKE